MNQTLSGKPGAVQSSLLDPLRREIDGWLDAKPAITATAVLARLKASYPDHVTDNHLRTTQRMVKAWRADQANRVIRCGAAVLQAATDASGDIGS